jgi:hypothetical protein
VLLGPGWGQFGEVLEADARGRRPSMMALTICGESDASERVMRTERSLQPSREAIASVLSTLGRDQVIEPGPGGCDRMQDAAAVLSLHGPQLRC